MRLLRYAALGERRRKFATVEMDLSTKRLVCSPLFCCHFGSNRDDTGGVHFDMRPVAHNIVGFFSIFFFFTEPCNK